MQPSRMKEALPHLGLLTVYLLWGINITSMKIGGLEWDPVIFNGLRYLSIVPILWVYTVVYHRKKKLPMRMERRDLLWMIVLSFASTIGMEVVLSYALQYSSTANGAVLGRGFMPIITAVIALVLKEVRLTWRIGLGIPLAFLSVIVIVGGKGLNFGAETLRGDLLLLMRSFVGAFYLIYMNRLVVKYRLSLLITLEITFGALWLLPWVIGKVDLVYLQGISQAGWISLAYTSILATLAAFTIHNWGLGQIGPFKASAYGYTLPVTAAVAGMVILHERLTLSEMVGGIGVLAAMYIVQSDRMKQAKQMAARMPQDE
ncbi:multidrug DMT transporter permease [Paenibacillus swuensis]|uniref:Multidrug DMT transporter permease n=1 Tax=Paenibacillus swuensis TaxID=1178515 RepID=A0A172TDD5_9BACL|nr:DMT family transporter [Paenibacillus swuensis]ANE45049.1 multidrug DMT transporter permease [Paenibacillus swuensis]